MKTLSLTAACKSLGDCVDRVHVHHESFAILKFGVPYALLVPAPSSGCDTHELAQDVAKAGLSPADRRSLVEAVLKGRKALKPLKNPWG